MNFMPYTRGFRRVFFFHPENKSSGISWGSTPCKANDKRIYKLICHTFLMTFNRKTGGEIFAQYAYADAIGPLQLRHRVT